MFMRNFTRFPQGLAETWERWTTWKHNTSGHSCRQRWGWEDTVVEWTTKQAAYQTSCWCCSWGWEDMYLGTEQEAELFTPAGCCSLICLGLHCVLRSAWWSLQTAGPGFNWFPVTRQWVQSRPETGAENWITWHSLVKELLFNSAWWPWCTWEKQVSHPRPTLKHFCTTPTQKMQDADSQQQCRQRRCGGCLNRMTDFTRQNPFGGAEGQEAG